jgi:hypothetical protein
MFSKEVYDSLCFYALEVLLIPSRHAAKILQKFVYHVIGYLNQIVEYNGSSTSCLVISKSQS